MQARPGLRDRLRRGELLLGTLLTLASPEAAELLGEAGFDWLFVDAEHGAFDPRSIQAVLQGAGRAVDCLVRVVGLDEGAIKQALDAGAAGVIVPQVETAEQAELAARWTRYPPDGARSLGIARAQGYGMQLREYLAFANDGLALVVQAETAAAVRNIEAIVRVPGVDAVFIGPYDLSGSLGYPGEPDHAEVRQAVEHIAQTCRGAGMPLGIFGLAPEDIIPYIRQGFTLIAAGADTVMLGGAAREMLGRLRVER